MFVDGLEVMTSNTDWNINDLCSLAAAMHYNALKPDQTVAANKSVTKSLLTFLDKYGLMYHIKVEV